MRTDEQRKYHRDYYHKKVKNNPEYKKKRAKYHKEEWADPIRRKKAKKRINDWRATPEGIYASLKNRNRKDFDLDRDEFIDWYNKQNKECSYCELTLEQIRKLPAPYNRKNGLIKFSIDRKNNDIGYRIDNIALCCFSCNTIKNNFLTYEDMKRVGKLILIPKFKKLLKHNNARRNKNVSRPGGT